MSEPITPALTPEEWKAGRFVPEQWAEVHVHSTGELTVRTIDPPAIFQPLQRHALAALALHGQPLGFTHEDVTMLREVACCPIHVTLCGSLAARIEALLPPP